jgi:hypothetical protein
MKARWVAGTLAAAALGAGSFVSADRADAAFWYAACTENEWPDYLAVEQELIRLGIDPYTFTMACDYGTVGEHAEIDRAINRIQRDITAEENQRRAAEEVARRRGARRAARARKFHRTHKRVLVCKPTGQFVEGERNYRCSWRWVKLRHRR